MARFYQVEDPRFVDPEKFIFKPPWEEIKASMQFQDTEIDKGIEAGNKFQESLLKIKYHNDINGIERDRVNSISKNYQDRINEVVNAIRSDPNNWRKFSAQMTEVGQDLQRNFLVGDISKIQGRAKQIEDWEASMAEIKKVNPDTYNKGRKKFIEDLDSRISDIDARFNGVNLSAQRNIPEELLGIIKHMESDVTSINKITPNGDFIVTQNGAEVVLPKEKINQAITAYFNDPKQVNYFKERQMLGDGIYFGEDGKYLPFEQSSLKNLLDFGAAFAYKKTEAKVNQEVNPIRMSEIQHQQEIARMQFQNKISRATGGGSGGGKGEDDEDIFFPSQEVIIKTGEEAYKAGLTLMTKSMNSLGIGNFKSNSLIDLQNKNVDLYKKGKIDYQTYKQLENIYTTSMKEHKVANQMASWGNLRAVGLTNKDINKSMDAYFKVYKDAESLKGKEFTFRTADGRAYKVGNKSKFTYAEAVKAGIISETSSVTKETEVNEFGETITKSETSQSWINPKSARPYAPTQGYTDATQWYMAYEGIGKKGERLIITTDYKFNY